MGFPVNSTSHQTAECKRAARVIGRTKADEFIAYAGCYNCRPIAGSSTMSQHSYGNALDIFLKASVNNKYDALARIFHAIIYQATHKTVANRMNRLKVAHVIDHYNRLIWTPSGGVQDYHGTYGPHVHVDFIPNYSGPCGSRP